jgi:hypothetical protein
MSNEDRLLLFDTLTGCTMDNLFWSLLYVNSAIFATPLAEESKTKLLRLHESDRAVLRSLYPASACEDLTAAMEENRQFFVGYVETLVQGNGQAPVMKERWRESGRRLARRLSQMNPYWRLGEWTAMIDHEMDLLETMTTSLMARNYHAFVSVAPVCRRLAMDMSNYLYVGVEKQEEGATP